MKQRLSEGDTDTALKLAEKAFALKPKHVETQDVLLKLQAGQEDWSGARQTLNAKLKYGALPRDVHRRRDAVLALSEARDVMADGSVAAEVDRVGAAILAGLRSRLDGVRTVGDIRGLGLLLGIELVEADGTTKAAGAGVRVAEHVLRDGIISLPAGDVGEVYELTPPLVLTDEQRDFALDRVAAAIVGAS